MNSATIALLVFAAAITEARTDAKNAKGNFIWWASHREYCGWRVGECDCLLSAAMREARPPSNDWFYRRMDAVRAAAGFHDDRKRRDFNKWCTDRGLP